ncbi:CsbD family protein [Hahella aquimaris]|uniref:CsbD family protein n=1 Tax=Hahella sp. HNIBRBA332 TaxID=3015983 RepID=UPI00273AA2BC|nr:CsbD family protein [Hahella sp. HNIBRBA332]WLQ16328.1 CsbD family protein [Hahella sp. HNIBRBA332]
MNKASDQNTNKGAARDDARKTPPQGGQSSPQAQSQKHEPGTQQQPQHARPMTPQQQTQSASIDVIKGKWNQHVGAAKVAWGKLTEDEILKSEGNEQKLAGLVQERYAITRDEANEQVKGFLEKCKS